MVIHDWFYIIIIHTVPWNLHICHINVPMENPMISWSRELDRLVQHQVLWSRWRTNHGFGYGKEKVLSLSIDCLWTLIIYWWLYWNSISGYSLTYSSSYAFSKWLLVLETFSHIAWILVGEPQPEEDLRRLGKFVTVDQHQHMQLFEWFMPSERTGS